MFAHFAHDGRGIDAEAQKASVGPISASGPFYLPSPELFGQAQRFRLFMSCAAALQRSGLADRFPRKAELRHLVIELIAERYTVEQVEKEPALIWYVTNEARGILDERRKL